jgi:hypothetical protein
LALKETMGTANDWIVVACAAIFWGGFMLLWESLNRSDEHIKPAVSLVDVLLWAVAGLGFGIGTTFRWRAFHWPLILPMTATLAAFFILARLVRRKVRSSDG